MATLTKFIYGSHIDPKKTPFGLINNQTRVVDEVISCAGWFNASGEKLGAGDLSIADMARISKHIGKEAFLVLSEGDSLWNVPSGANASAPGVDYVMQKCLWHISGAGIIRVRDGKDEDAEREGVKYKRMKRQTFFNTIGYGATAKPIEKAEPAEEKKIVVDEATKLIAKKLGVLLPKKVSTLKSPALIPPLMKPISPAKPAAQPVLPGVGGVSAPTVKKVLKKKTTVPFP
jgi:hypothetical protein